MNYKIKFYYIIQFYKGERDLLIFLNKEELFFIQTENYLQIFNLNLFYQLNKYNKNKFRHI